MSADVAKRYRQVELECAVLLGVDLLNSIVQFLRQVKIVASEIHGWSDSTILLCWLSKEPKYLSTFVANRGSEIKNNSDVVWNHVPRDDNPADPASRGVNPSLLQKCSLWWKRPEWLTSLAVPDKQNIVDTHEEIKRTPFESTNAKVYTAEILDSTTITVNNAQDNTDINDVINLGMQNSLTKR